MNDEAFPIVGEYRGVGLHAFQPAERIEDIVKPAIDTVHAMSDLRELAAYAGGMQHPPEARRLAAAKCEAGYSIAVDERRQRPALDMQRVRASVAGLTRKWMSRTHYRSDLDVRLPQGGEDAAKRDVPLSDEV